MKRWLLMEIGCLECGNPSNVAGVYDTAAAALDAGGAGTKLAGDMHSDDWHGSAIMVVFDLDATP